MIRTPLIRACAVLALAVVAPQSVLAEPLPDGTRVQLAATIAEFYESAGPPAVTVLVDRRGETVFEMSIGMADVAEKRAADGESVYAIGSITKSFTALATLQLVEGDQLRLDDTVGKWLTDYTGPGRDVTIAQLLDHTSGIPNYTDDRKLYPRLQRDAWTRPAMVANFAALPLSFAPGSRWSYTNSGYYLLGLIIEKVSGLDYYEYLQRHVFAPLGMDRTYSGDDAAVIPARARGYRGRGATLTQAPPWHYLVPFAAGSLLSTAQDLARYRRGVFTSAQFSPTLRELVTRTRPLADGTPNLYALGGLVVGEFGGRRKWSHSGEIFGFHSNHAYYPDEDLTIIVLTNRMGLMPSPVSLEHKLARILLDVPRPARTPVSLTPAQLARFTGDYELRPFLFGPPRYTVALESGALVLKIGGPEAEGLPLLPVGDGLFVSALDDEWTVEFNLPRGREPATSFTMSVADGRLSGYRTSH